MITAIALFASSFVLVFMLGFQSLNVNGGHYSAAFWTSFGIGTSQLVLYKLVPGADILEVIAYLAGGPLGILASMWTHRRTIGKPKMRVVAGRPITKKANINCGDAA